MSDAARDKRTRDKSPGEESSGGRWAGEKRPGGLTRLRGRLRQRRYPPEFRIPSGYPPQPVRDLARESTPESARVSAAVPHQAPPALPEDLPHTPDAALADLATNLWRLGKKLAEADAEAEAETEAATAGARGTGATSRRRATRHLRAALDALDKAGVRAQDHDGTPFDMGLALDVLAYQPVPEATRETVHETVRPSVYRDGRRIQLGQVIVARPEGEQDHES